MSKPCGMVSVRAQRGSLSKARNLSYLFRAGTGLSAVCPRPLILYLSGGRLPSTVNGEERRGNFSINFFSI